MNTNALKFFREIRSARAAQLTFVDMGGGRVTCAMIGCTLQTLHEWVKRERSDHGERDGVITDERERLKAL
ncbi:hypothetical protein AWB64_06032 [Caballeronia sordidicola]|uniref:Mobile element protein n=1 Tax=Caballeronia sordidicola TaxID=196367 RepID=A0A158IDS3_CABSO|nr:hypothetical protein AWB64_06032 [Caballeronia sordidicola]